jgi:hypothetical protein
MWKTNQSGNAYLSFFRFFDFSLAGKFVAEALKKLGLGF